MYDRKTSSMWSTLHGEPVIGPLVGKGITLKRRSVVTTTWGEWSQLHPGTSVLSLNTGYRRNYGEGVAYESYFSTDRLMFETPKSDTRLPNKRQVVALRSHDKTNPVAIDTQFLKKNPVYSVKVGADHVVILTTPQGASRVYQAKNHKFISLNDQGEVIDQHGERWKISESELIHSSQEALVRYPSHQSFWFGWVAQFPKTRLIK